MIIKYIANAGILICDSEYKILIDAINTKSCFPFSSTPTYILNKIINNEDEYKNIDYILFTHIHKDHCDLEKLSQIKNHKAKIILPELSNEKYMILSKNSFLMDNQVNFLSGNSEKEIVVNNNKNLTIKALKTSHDGNYKEISHYSYLICINGVCILIMGDADVTNKNIEVWLENKKINIACVNFVEINQSKGRNFINNIINPNIVISYHLPVKDEDINNIIRMHIKNIEKYKHDLPEIHPFLNSEEEVQYLR